ncbi:MAG: phosphotransferase [Candidatus Babeliales bacterium]|nr:phosphotransferase [Candidatus Babeliales bacterium]
MNNEQSFEEMIKIIITASFWYYPKSITRIAIGICNEVYNVGLVDKEVIVRLSFYNKFLMGSHDHIPQFKNLGIKVPTILFEDYSRTLVPMAYQIQTKIDGQDLGHVIETLSDEQLKLLAREIANIFYKVKTITPTDKFGLIWGGGDNDVSDSWTERIRIWIDESEEYGTRTGVMDDFMLKLAEKLFVKYKSYFDAVKPITYFGDLSSKNVMIHNGKFTGLVDLDGLTQGDPLEAIGRIKLSWYGTHYGQVYTDAIMDEMSLNSEQRNIVTMYALLNQISWTCNNGIQFNQNTQAIVDQKKEEKDKAVIKALASELQLI